MYRYIRYKYIYIYVYMIELTYRTYMNTRVFLMVNYGFSWREFLQISKVFFDMF